MAITQLSPGVKVNEIDLTNVITTASSSVGAFVGDFTWGPIEEVTTISREKELTSIFGKPSKFKATDFTALSLFLKYTDRAEVVRMVDSAARNATADTISGGRLIKNRDHYDGLTGTLSALDTVTLSATANSLVGSYEVTVGDASQITGGDVITGTNITAGATVVGIQGNVVTLSHPLEGVIPDVTFTHDTVEIFDTKVIQSVFAAGSQLVQVTNQAAEYQVGASAFHYEPAGGVAAFPNNTAILPAVADFVIGEQAVGGSNSGQILSTSVAQGEVVVDVIAPGFTVADTVAGTTDGVGVVDSVNIHADISLDPSKQYIQLASTTTAVQLAVGEAANFAVNDAVIGGTSGVSGTVQTVDAVNDVIEVLTYGSVFTVGETISGGSAGAGTGVVATSDIGVGEFAVGDTVVGATSGTTGIISVVDTVNNVLHITAAGAYTNGESITGGSVLPGTGTVTAVSASAASNFILGDTVTGAMSGATAVITAVDAVNNVVTVRSASAAFTLTEELTGGSTIFGSGAVVALDYREALVLRRVPNGSLKMAAPLTSNLPCAERIAIDQKFTFGTDTVIGSFTFNVSDASFIEVGDEIVELGIADGSMVTAITPVDTFTLGAGEAANFAVGDVARATGGSGAFGTVGMVDVTTDTVVVFADAASVAFVAGDVLDKEVNGVTTVAQGTIAAIVTPVKYSDDMPATVTVDLAVTDVIPAGTQADSRRVQDLDCTVVPAKSMYLVLDNLDGVIAGDEVDPYTAVAGIKTGTEIASIDPVNNVVKLNQPIDEVVAVNASTPVIVSRRVDVAQNSHAEATVIYVSDTSSVAPGDSVIDITGAGLQLNTKVVSVDAGTGAVTLDTPLTGTIPTAVNIGDSLSVEVYRGPFYAKYAGMLGNSLKVEMCGSAADYAGWAYAAYFNAAPGTSDYTHARGGSNDELHIVVLDEDGKFTGTPGTVLESFAFVSQAIDAKLADGTNNYYVDVINDRSAYLYWGAHDPSLVNAGAEAAGTAFAQLASNISVSFSEGVDSGALGVAEWSVGFELFRDVETIVVDFLIQPSIPNSADGLATQQLLVDIAEFRTDCMAMLSPPVELTAYGSLNPVSDVIAWMDQINSTSYAALDSCAIKVYDKFNDQYLMIPASSSVAGLCARTDRTRDPWFSPAGYNRGQLLGVVKLAHIPRKVERDQLYSSRINPLATFPGEGTILYGDKTALTRPSAFDRINVRRLFITLERAISNASKYMLFEFNDAFTRAQFVALVEPFLRNVKGGRGITDFQVVCDETNNTPQVIDTNQFVGDIYIKPNRSINFITLNFVAVRTGVSFQEIATGLYGE